jgi:O-antigen/teichoic acid export membrane protein
LVGADPTDLLIDEPEPLLNPDVGLRVIRGGTIRGAGYVVGMALTAGASILLLRYLGVVEFGRYATVASLAAIVSGVTDAGLTAIGGRDLALRPPGNDRRRLLANMLGLRLVITPAGVLVATLFAIVVGYDRTLILGTVLAGIGVILTSAQTTATLPLTVDLRIGRLTSLETIRLAATFTAIVVLVLVRTDLLAIFAVSIVGATVTLAFLPSALGKDLVLRPAFDRVEWRKLIRETVPLAAAVVMGVLYFRLLVVVVSLVSSSYQTGLFATSFRVVEILYGVSALIATTALPVLAVSGGDRERLSRMIQRMSEVALIAASFLAVVVAIVAAPVLEFLGGRGYREAAPVLQLQVLALIPVFLAHTLQLGLISVRRQAALAGASGFALALALSFGFGLVPSYGAKGGAVAAVVAESGYVVALFGVLAKFDRSLLPNFKFAWKVALAALLAVASVLLAALSAPEAGVLGGVVFAGVIWLTRALPPEVVEAFGMRRRDHR